MKKLNLGCGRDIKQGYVNLDMTAFEGVDIVHNIDNLPLPFENEEFDEIYCKDILEHVNYPSVMQELHRILKKGGVLKIYVPHFTCRDNFVDPTHKRQFSFRTFEFFIKGNKYKGDYYSDFYFSRILYKRITFPKGKQHFYNYLTEYLVNLNDRTRDFYEMSFLRVFPAGNICVYIVK